MHELFADWIRTLNPDQDLSSLPLSRWWEAIDVFVENADASQVVELARSAHQQPSAGFDSTWRNHLRDYDEVSPLRGEHRHVAVLASAALIHASETGPNQDLAMCARRCATQNGWQPAIDDVALTAQGLGNAASAARTLMAWPSPRRTNVSTKNINEHMPEAEGETSGAQLSEVVGQIVASVNDALQRSAQGVVRVAAERERVMLEQSDVLVWLLSGQSTTAGGPWKKLSPMTAAIAAAVELQGLSRFVLGRPDAQALIAQTVTSAGKESKTHTDPAQLDDILSRADLPPREAAADLTPISWQVMRGISIAASEDHVSIGMRVHDELGLLKAMK